MSALLAEVRAGETIVIEDRGVPIARLEGVAPLRDDPDGRLARLQRAGLVRVGRGEPPVSLLSKKLPRPKHGASVVQALIDERRAGR
jgi:antitoxin (DNA-binding transcriptional repressor) of toxin-antitoxin stability system